MRKVQSEKSRNKSVAFVAGLVCGVLLALFLGWGMDEQLRSQRAVLIRENLLLDRRFKAAFATGFAAQVDLEMCREGKR